MDHHIVVKIRSCYQNIMQQQSTGRMMVHITKTFSLCFLTENILLFEVVMFGLYPVCRVLSLEVVEYSLSCRVLTLVYFSKLVEYSP